MTGVAFTWDKLHTYNVSILLLPEPM